MKILQVIPYYIPALEFGGPVSSITNISRILAQRGHEVTVYTTDTLGSLGRVNKKEEIIDGIKVQRFSNLNNSLAYRHNLYISMDMIIKIKREQTIYDIVHLHEYRTLQNIVMRGYALKYGIPYIVQAHGSLPRIMAKEGLKRIFDNIYGKRLLGDASRLIALTVTELEQYKSIGIGEGKIEIVPNGIDSDEFENLPPKGEFRKKWNIPDEQKIILFLARIHKIKGVDILVKAFAEIAKNTDDLKLVLAGPDGGFLKYVKRLVNELGIEAKVMFTGPVYGRDKLEVYVDADIYVLPSRYEIFGITALEACACGTPVILTDNCGIANEINGQAGISVPCDEEQVRQTILYLLSNEKIRLAMGTNGKQLVDSRFSWSQITNQIESMYQKISFGH